ncbi:MAG: spermidine/putrescine-binding protein [Halioglobus sp.]|jgi:spermidine/putrescine-binding protein
MDCLSVTKRGAHSALAYEFIDFLLEAKVAAELSEAIWIATPNMAAKELLSADYLNDKSVFPSDAILEKSEVQSTQPIEIQTIRNKILLSLEDN